MMGNFTRWVGLGIATAGLVACGGGGSGGSDSGGTGQMSLAVTDAPVDSASRVVVRFTHIELQPSDGERIRIDLGEDEEVREIDLLTLQGEDSEFLFEDEEVPAGEYAWLRFHLEESEEVVDFPGSQGGIATTSFIEFMDGNEDRLIIPGGNQAGLQLSGGFSVPEDGEVSFTVDFDLRKAIVEDSRDGFHRMRRSLRLVDNDAVGAITGTVDPTLFPDDFTCEEREEGLHACPGAAVYVFEGLDREPRDLRDDDDDAVTTANVQYRHIEETGDWEYRYTAGFLEAGEYTVALTFEAGEDDPEEETPIEFVDQANAEVEAGETTEVNF